MSTPGASSATVIGHPILPGTVNPVFVYLCKRLPGAKVDRARKYAVVGCTKRGGEYEYELHGEVKGEMRTFKVDTRYYSFYAAGH